VGQASAVSFYPTKNLGAFGDAGAVVSSDGKAIEAMRSMRDYGQTSKFEHSVYGMNSRLDELHAAILADVLLPRLSEWTIRRRALARRYLAEIRHPRIRPIVKLDPEESVWHLFPVAVEGDRESFRGHLADCGIETALHYPRLITEQPFLAHQGVKTKGSLQRATRLAHQEVSLPIHPWMSDAEQNQVLEALRTWPG
jgi:dTDP-4-amino-4,6-dideoxygalactose transaminase